MDLVFSTKNAPIHLPEKVLKEGKPSYTYVPLRGFDYELAVMEAGKPVGWILTETLGFPSVYAWQKKSRR